MVILIEILAVSAQIGGSARVLPVYITQRDAFYLTEPDADRPIRCGVAGLEVAAGRDGRRCSGDWPGHGLPDFS